MTKGIDAFFRKNLWVIGCAVFALIVWGVTLQLAVTAQAQDFTGLEVREQLNKGTFIELIETVHEIKETVIEINVNQQHIMRELGIAP